MQRARRLAVRLAIRTATGLATWALAWAGVSAVAQTRTEADPPAADPAIAAGRTLYQTGLNRLGGALQATLGTGVALDGPRVACARCHGHDGQGSREAGLTVPALRWATLSRARHGQSQQIDRAPYDATTLLRAVRHGVDPAGRALAPAMPRFSLAPRDEADLIAYLNVLGGEADADPGVLADRVVLGGALPLSGPQADAGRAADDAVRACIARANRSGGVFGRQIDWQVHDSASPEGLRQAGTLAQRSFAVVAPWWPGLRSSELADRLAGAPLIGPLGAALELDRAAADTYVVASQLSDQARVLVDAVAMGDLDAGGAGAGNHTLFVIAAPDPLDSDLLRAVRRQAQLHPQLQLQIWSADAQTAPSPTAATAWLARERARLAAMVPAASVAPAVLVLGPTAWLQPVAEALADRGAVLGTKGHPPGSPDGSPSDSTATATVTLLALYPQHGRSSAEAWAQPVPGRHLRWAHPQLGAAPTDPTPMWRDLQAIGAEPRMAAVQSLAYAAACVAVEGLRRSGRDLHRASFRSALDGLHDFQTGVIAPLAFSPGNRVGSHGSGIGRYDAAQRAWAPVRAWRAPAPW